MTMADRVVVLRDGRLQQLDAPQSLYDDPANLFVAGFIGSPAMNLVGATLAEAGPGRVYATFGSHRLLVPPAVLNRRPGVRGAAGRPVIVGIRPEDLEDAEFASHTDPDALLDVTVTLAEPLGAEVVAHFDIDAPPVRTPDTADLAADVDPGGEPPAAAGEGQPEPAERVGFTARLHPRTAVRAGRSVKLAVDVERLHLFDPATGLTLS
jgi:multiple sugar transport system ATP-binding protein